MQSEKGSATVPVALFGVSPNSWYGRFHSPFGVSGRVLPARRLDADGSGRGDRAPHLQLHGSGLAVNAATGAGPCPRFAAHSQLGLLIVPSLDLVIYKMGGNNGQYDPTLTGLPQPAPDASRDEWKPIPRTPFHEGSLGGDDGLRRVLEMVCAAVRE